MEVQPAFDSEFFRGNRRRLREQFGGTAPIVLSANAYLQKSADSTYPFVQDSSFWYLTGLNLPGLTLVMDADREYLILPDVSQTHLQFSGYQTDAVISETSGIESVLKSEDGWRRLERKLKKAKHVATIQPPADYIEPMMMFTSPARARLVAALRSCNETLDLIDLRPHLAQLRIAKQEPELVALRRAIDLTAEAYKAIQKILPKAMSETDILAKAQYVATKSGCEFAYDPIIASGANGLILHYIENNASLSDGDMVLIDLGLRFQNYCADVTRTVIAEPNKRQQAVYDAVLSVHEFACSLIKPGINLTTYEAAVTQYMGEKLRELGLIKTITQESMREYYPHATSHFIGIDVHDVGSHENPIPENAVLSVEPGIYIAEENIAIRIEDTVRVSSDGVEVLSSAIPKVIDRLA